MQFILGFKVVYLNARGWSARPKHVAYIDETNEPFFWLSAVGMSIFKEGLLNWCESNYVTRM